MLIRRLSLTLAVLLVVGVASAHAASIVLTRAGIGETDSLAWGVLGSTFTVVPDGTSQATLLATNTVTISTSTGTDLERRDAGSGWGTGSNFPSGTELLWTRNEDTASLILDFAFPILAGGLDIGRDAFGDYTAYVTAFRGATNLGTFSVAGSANANIPFLGVFDALGITRLVYNVDLNTADFAVDTLSIQTPAAIPEPGSFLLVATGIAAVARRWRSRRSPAAV